MGMPAISIAVAGEHPISPEAVSQLYSAVGWWPERTAAVIATILEASVAVGAWEEDRLIGFARAVTDGRTRAYIEDVAVLPGYRQRGIGERVLRHLLGELRAIDTVSLFCHHDLVGWYERVGFVARSSQTVMHLRRR